MTDSSAAAICQPIRLPVHDNLRCEVYTQASQNTFKNEHVAIVWCGNIYQEQDKLSGADLAQLYQDAKDIQAFYQQLHGRFWLLTVDNAAQQLTLVNDQMGIQPCYYSLQDGCLYVSESLEILRQQAKVTCTLSKQAIYNYFYFHCIPAPDTIYQECFKLAPANAISFNAQTQQQCENLYRPDFAKQITDTQLAQKECLTTLDETVKQQVSENCGAFLSGGLDSSTVAGMLAKHQTPAKTFSIGFDVPAYDETAYAKLTAEHFNTEHKVLYLTPEMAAKEFVKVAQYFDEPFGNSSAMAAYFCATFAKQNGVTHLLAGDGGDELFAGNERYAKQKVFEHFHQAPKWLQALPRVFFNNELARKIPIAKKAASYIEQADVPLPDRMETFNFIKQLGAQNMFESAFLADIDSNKTIELKRQRYSECKSDDPVDSMLYLDWKFTLADNDLVKVTKMCELAGVSVDFPFLDRKLIDFSCSVPAETKLPGGKLRDFYKKSCEGFLNDATLNKSKHGFGLPFGVWMKQNQQLKDITAQCLNAFKQRNIVKDSLIDDALKAHDSVHASYYGELIWIMVILELWLQGKE
ncbi:asparagine synthase-related protein [uncultured Paraglaciecola sp.]|uniref:asparagine synthetase B family protein n=1 Tax=uncultured Paraglaciecola sp. TaxID=1765024 RepID=UPI002623D92E|nr:asparagine synthase-related protein [uncultured Paraglaciecola sp.]